MKKKVLFISSTGGHLDELLQLSPLFEKYDYNIITEKDKTNEYLKQIYGKKIHFLPYLSHFLLWKSYPNLIIIDSKTILM